MYTADLMYISELFKYTVEIFMPIAEFLCIPPSY